MLLIQCLSTAMLLIACSGQSNANQGIVNPRDTVNVPDGLTGEDSITYIEDAVLKSPISAQDLIGMAEVHVIEGVLHNYAHHEEMKDNPQYANDLQISHQDSAAMRLANRFMRMNHLVSINGKANDWLQWAVAVNAALDTFCVEVPSVPHSSALDEIGRVMEKFSSQTQFEMNYQCYVDATVECYRTIEAYRRLLEEVPADLKPLIHEEYEAWHDLNEARFTFWSDVSYRQEWYSMKPMEIHGYNANLSENRRAELKSEREIILDGKNYQQKGKTVTTAQWEQWIKDHSVPEDIDFLKEMKYEDRIPDDSIVAERVKHLKSAFARWLAARHAIAAALPEAQGRSYDNITADIHCRMIGKLADIVSIDEW